MRKGKRLIAVFIVAILAASCSTPNSRVATSASFEWTSPSRRILLIKPDVELSSLQAGGSTEVRADWTDAAERFIAADVAKYFSQKNAELVPVNTITDPREIQLVKLNGVVGQAIRTHLYNSAFTLPNKGKALDWTLGPGTNALRDRYGADYALFVFVRDSYTSAGRALMMVGAAVFGVGIQGGQQIGFASLVDLRTGNIVWFNQLLNNNGDLRSEAPAQKTVNALLANIPL